MAWKAPMTLETGATKLRSGVGGFTLIEILLVIALIAVASTLVIVNFAAFVERGASRAPEEVLRSAIREARFTAAADRVVTELRYDDESGSLLIDPGGASFPINADFGPDGRGEIRFYLIPPTQGLNTFSDPDRTNLETPAVSFAPDRSSSPFVAEIDLGSGTPVRLRFDPFSDVVRTSK
jgi:prepilin-type N-terminal cleavage/methylation domain-containing protein